MTIDLIIKNGIVITPSGSLKTDVAIKGEQILALGDESAFPKAERVIDANGKIVIPGGVDHHSHIEISFMGETSPETWDVPTIAAAIVGTSTTVDFAARNADESLLDAVKRQFSKAAKLSAIDYTTKGMLVNLTDLDKVIST